MGHLKVRNRWQGILQNCTGNITNKKEVGDRRWIGQIIFASLLEVRTSVFANWRKGEFMGLFRVKGGWGRSSWQS